MAKLKKEEVIRIVARTLMVEKKEVTSRQIMDNINKKPRMIDTGVTIPEVVQKLKTSYYDSSRPIFESISGTKPLLWKLKKY